MAIYNLDGVTAAIDVTITPGSGGTATSTKCLWGSVETDIQTDLFSYQTFCSGAWESVREGASRMLFVLIGYVSNGGIYAKPGSLRGLVAGSTMAIQYDTGCTITFAPKISRDRNVTAANGATVRSVEGRADGQPTIAWVTV